MSYERLLNIAFIYPWLFLLTSVFLLDDEQILSVFLPAGAVAGYVAGLVVKRHAEAKVERVWLRSLLLGFAVAVAVAGAAIGGYLRYKAEQKLRLYLVLSTLISIAVFIVLSLSADDGELSAYLLFLFLLPVFNAPLDWLSLGVTRGLLLNIASDRHRSLSSLGWALVDIVLALVFLVAVAASSFVALLLARAVSPESVYSNEQLRVAISGGDDLSIGIWLMLASTLLPTFLHFLVALLAFVSLPFSRKKASETAVKLQSARDEALRRVNEDTNQSAGDVPVDAYARRWAMAYFGISWPVVFVLWIILVSFLSYVIYKVMQWMYLTLLPAV